MFKSKYCKRYVLVQTELIQGSPMTSVKREVRWDVHNGPFWLHNLWSYEAIWTFFKK